MELRLLKHQMKFLTNFLESETQPWAEAIVSGFGAGKTFTLSSTALILMMRTPGINIGVYSATFDLLRLVNLPSVIELCDALQIKQRTNKADMITAFPDYGSKIIFRSMDNPSRIIGYEHAYAFVDELDTLTTIKAEESWNKIIARNRQKLPNFFCEKSNKQIQLKNKIGVGTTPEGFKFCYKKWDKDPSPGYRQIKAKTADNIHLPAEYVNNLRESYSDQLIEAYLNGEYVNLTGNSVYHAFDRFENNTEYGFDGFDFLTNKFDVGVLQQADKYAV